MGKAISDVPGECRGWFKIFEQIAYRWQYSEVFDDYLTMLMNWFANGTMIEERDRALKKYDAKEKGLFNQLFIEHVKLMELMVVTRDYKWYDALGDIYQAISSSSKSSAMGQFFTPGCVTDLMASIVGVDEGPYHFINEPCCGSGRLILSAHARQPLNYYWAIDLDQMCVKMTAINMCFHNAAGVVTHGNALWLEQTSYSHYIIDRVQLDETTFVPLIKKVEYNEAMDWLGYLDWYTTVMKGQPYVRPQDRPRELKPVKAEKIEAVKANVLKNKSQLSLF